MVGKAQHLFAYLVSDKTVPNKLKVFFATMVISIAAHVKLMKHSLIFDELVKALLWTTRSAEREVRCVQ